MKTTGKSQVLATRVGPLTYEQVEQAAAARGISMAEMLRFLIEDMLIGEDPKRDLELKWKAMEIRQWLLDRLESVSFFIKRAEYGPAIERLEILSSRLKAIEAGEHFEDIFPELFVKVEEKEPLDLVVVPFPGGRPGEGIKVEKQSAIAAGLWPPDDEGKSEDDDSEGKT